MTKKLRKKKLRLVRKPFKGSNGYEWQVGPFVLIWFYRRTSTAPSTYKILRLGRLLIWRDIFWRMH